MSATWTRPRPFVTPHFSGSANWTGLSRHGLPRSCALSLHVEGRLTSNRGLRLAVMSPLSEDKLLSFLAEIQSDIRQIKSDLQALVTLLKQQQATPTSFADGDHMAEPAESGRSASPEDILRYLRETRGEDDTAE
jgi:hypothetical protein